MDLHPRTCTVDYEAGRKVLDPDDPNISRQKRQDASTPDSCSIKPYQYENGV